MGARESGNQPFNSCFTLLIPTSGLSQRMNRSYMPAMVWKYFSKTFYTIFTIFSTKTFPLRRWRKFFYDKTFRMMTSSFHFKSRIASLSKIQYFISNAISYFQKLHCLGNYVKTFYYFIPRTNFTKNVFCQGFVWETT